MFTGGGRRVLRGTCLINRLSTAICFNCAVGNGGGLVLLSNNKPRGHRGYYRVHTAFARFRAFKLAAATSVLSVAAVATATPTALHSPSEQAILAAIGSDLQTIEIPAGSVSVGNFVETENFEASEKGDLALVRHRVGTQVEEMPFAGQIATLDMTAPYEPNSPALSFEARQASFDQVAYSAFVKPATMVALNAPVARLPHARPQIINAALQSEAPAVQPAVLRHGEAPNASVVLAYAPAAESIEAPFDAVIGAPRIAGRGDEDADGNMPRPRPDQATVAEWLDGRSLRQFDPGQHDWVQNKLPESSFTEKQQKCLAEGIYFEARGESELGQAAVAQVILNRVRNPAYPNTICGVVYQNKSWRNRCQFSFACDGIPDRIRSQQAWRTAVKVAKQVTDGDIWLADVGDSTHYYADYVSPRWARTMIKVDRIGAHIFYRTRYGGWS